MRKISSRNWIRLKWIGNVCIIISIIFWWRRTFRLIYFLFVMLSILQLLVNFSQKKSRYSTNFSSYLMINAQVLLIFFQWRCWWWYKCHESVYMNKELLQKTNSNDFRKTFVDKGTFDFLLHALSNMKWKKIFFPYFCKTG